MRLLLGVDGGGSGTTAVVVTSNGHIIGRAQAGPSNIHSVGKVAAREAILESVSQALAASLPVTCRNNVKYMLSAAGVLSACFGMAGAGREEDRTAYCELIDDAGLVATDSEIALDAATKGGPGVLLISGTGSACLGRMPSGELVRAGGYGHVVGDEGSGYEIGRQAIAACLRAQDGRGPATTLTGRILAATGLADISDIPSLLRAGFGRPEIAVLSGVVLQEAYESKDSVAWSIVTAAQDELCRMAYVVQCRTGGSVALSGGVFNNSQRFTEAIVDRLCAMRPSISVGLLELPPVAGAIWRAARQSGMEDIDLAEFAGMKHAKRDSGAAAGGELLDSNLPVTEARNPRSGGLGSMTAPEIAALMNSEDHAIAPAIAACLDEIATVMQWAGDSLRSAGRLVYVGAGTSGRLGVLDASECPPTFGVRADQVVGIQAGGAEALFRSIEGAEDDIRSGAAKMDELGISSKDTVVGIAASGGTRFTLGALQRAAELGARTAALVSNPGSPMTRVSHRTICPVVGPEVLTGSTRLKSGTSHKMVLNMISTGAMVLTGKVYGNLMVDVVASNQKLRDRAVRIVARGAGVDEDKARAALEKCDMEIKTALVVLLAGVDPIAARQALQDSSASVAATLLRLRRN